jgi:WD40 repeat protein
MPGWEASGLMRAVRSVTPAPRPASDGRARVFISYSRKDVEFATWLRRGLDQRGVLVFRDIEDTLPGEEWWRRLQGLISQADTVIFVLSPNSVASSVCRDEVAYALKLSKRVFPAVIADVNWALAPEGLVKLHGLFFDDVTQRDAALGHLVEALETDIGWIREHTRLGEIALHWDAHQRPAGELLRGRALEHAEQWLTQRPKTARSPTNLHQEYILASRSAARQRGRLAVVVSLALAIAMTGIGIFAWLQKQEAQLQQAAVQRREVMLQVQKSRLLTEFANQSLRDGDPVTAALLAVEALPDLETNPERPYYSSAEFALHKALRQRQEHLVLGGKYIVRNALFSSDERQVLTAENDGRVRIWDATTGKAVDQLEPRKRGARTLSYSADGRRIVVGYDDGVARLFDAETRSLLLELPPQAQSIRVAVFSPDGSRLLTAGEGDSTVWDATSGERKFSLTAPRLTVHSAAFSPDGGTILTVSQDHIARIWNAQSGERIAELRAEVSHAAYSPDGKRIVTATQDGTARVWSDAGNELDRLVGNGAPVLFAEFSPDGAYIITTSEDKTARLWSLAARAAVRALGQVPGQLGNQVQGHVLVGHTDSVRSAVFSGDGKRVATISDDLSVRVWDVERGTRIAVFKGHLDRITSAVFSKDGQMLLTASEDSTARIWTTKAKADYEVLEGSDEALFAAFSADGKRLVTTYGDGTVRLWDGETGALIRLLKGPKEEVVSAAFRRDAKEIVTASRDGPARIWDLEADNEYVELEPDPETEGVNSAVYSPDGRFILTASNSGRATLWQGGRRLRDFKLDASELFSAGFSRDGRRIVVASANGTAGIWSAESGKLLVVLKGHTGPCWTAFFSSDGSRVLTAGDTTARLWDSATGRQINSRQINIRDPLSGSFVPSRMFSTEFDPTERSVLMVTRNIPFVYRWDLESGEAITFSGEAAGSPDDGAHSGQVARTSFGPQGLTVVTASNEGTARLWDVATGAPIDILRHSETAVSSAAISPDGRRIVTTSKDGSTRLWRAFASTQELINFAKLELPRCLRPEQRQRFGLEGSESPWCRALSKWPIGQE